MIGSNLSAALVDSGIEVYIVDNLWRGRLENVAHIEFFQKRPENIINRDLSIPGAIDDIVGKVDCVYHLADVVAGIGFVFSNQRWLFHKNLIINSNVFDSIVRCNPELSALIYVGTACSYPRELQYGVSAKPLREEQMFPANPESAYGWSKLMGQIEAQLLQQDCGIPVALPILHNVYGTPCDTDPKRSQVIPALCRRAAEAERGAEISVWGSGKQGRAFVHVDDVVDALIKCYTRGLGGGDVQIGPNECTSIGQIAECIAAASGKDLRVSFDATKPEGDGGRCADGTKAREMLGWTPKVDMMTGLSRTYEWVSARI